MAHQVPDCRRTDCVGASYRSAEFGFGKVIMNKESDYVEAVDNYHRLLDKYFRIPQRFSGGTVAAGEPLTSLARRELREAYAEFKETREKLGL